MKIRVSLFILSALSIIACNNDIKLEPQTPKIDISKESIDIKINFNPNKAILFENYLILFGQDTSENYCLIAFDVNKNQIDSAKFENFCNTPITNIFLKNDTLLAYFKNEKSWKFWSNNWINYSLKNEWFFVKKELNVIKHLYEDSIYVVFGFDFGEFGGTINFHNKKTKKMFVSGLNGPNFCTKVDGKYIVNGSLAHMDGSVEILEIENPEDLHFFPDSLNIYTNDTVGNYFNYLEKCNYKLLPDSIVKKLKNRSNFDYKAYKYSKQIIKNKLNIKTIIDTIGLLCYSTFQINKQVIYFMSDSTLFISTLYNDSLYVVDELYKESFFTYNYSSQSFGNSILMTFSYWQRKYKKEKMICLVWIDNKLKRINVY